MRYDISKTVFFFTVLILCLHCDISFAYGATSRVSVSTGELLGNGNSYLSSLSTNGRYVAFVSSASNLVAYDTNGTDDVFIHDRLTKQTTRVSVDSNGNQANDLSEGGSISADGRYVAFVSYATNLVDPKLAVKTERIYVHDRSTKQTTLVSGRGSDYSTSPSISGDGRYVAFASDSSTLVPGDINGTSDIFVHDRQSKQTTIVSVDSSGQQVNDWSSFIYGCEISVDGRYVVFMSENSNLVAGDTNNLADVFVHDRLTHQTTRINVNSNGFQTNNLTFYARISANGRFVTYSSYEKNLVSGDLNYDADVFVYDQLNHQTTIASINSKGVAGGGYYSSISPDGRYVAFTSQAALIPGDTNRVFDVYLRDRLKQTTTRASVGNDGNQLDVPSYGGLIGTDGRYVLFNNVGLVASDFNGFEHIFVRDLRLDTSHQADLQVTLNQKPPALVRNTQGSYIYNISNNGPDDIGILRVTHLVSKGQVIGFTPSQGACNRYATISLCELGLLPVGGAITLQLDIKANAVPSLNQQISISSNGRADPIPGNNYLTVNTPVTLP